MTEIDALREQVATLTQERDEAITHDRQPYPTAHAYETVCAALAKHRARAEAAERERDTERAARLAAEETLGEIEGITSLWEREYGIYGVGMATTRVHTQKGCAVLIRAALRRQETPR